MNSHTSTDAPATQAADTAGGVAVDVVITRPCAGVRRIEIIDARGCIIGYETFVGHHDIGNGRIEIAPVIKRGQELRKLYGLWECEG